MGISKTLKENEKGGKRNFISILKKKFKRKTENNKRTLYDWHHVTCFVLETGLPKATGHISKSFHKRKHFTHNCTVCDLKMEALGDVHYYLCLESRGKKDVLLK